MKIAFIIGCPRSGTSWMWGLLTSHPDVEPLLIEDFPGIKSVGGVTKMDLGDKYRTTETTIFQSNLTDEQIKKAVMAKAGKYKGKLLVEKTPANALQVKRIKKVFPDAKFILMIRDPRANINSMLKTEFSTGFKFAHNIEDGIHIYRQFYEATKEFLKEYPEFLIVKYEDLHKKFKKAYQELSKFLEISEVSGNALKQIQKENKNQTKSVQENLFRKGKVDSYKKELTKEEKKLIEEKLEDVFSNYNFKR